MRAQLLAQAAEKGIELPDTSGAAAEEERKPKKVVYASKKQLQRKRSESRSEAGAQEEGAGASGSGELAAAATEAPAAEAAAAEAAAPAAAPEAPEAEAEVDDWEQVRGPCWSRVKINVLGCAQIRGPVGLEAQVEVVTGQQFELPDWLVCPKVHGPVKGVAFKVETLTARRSPWQTGLLTGMCCVADSQVAGDGGSSCHWSLHMHACGSDRGVL